MINFPNSDFSISTFTINGFYTSCVLINNNKIKFSPFSCDSKKFMNTHMGFATKTLERKFSCLAHNIFGFDFYFIMRGIRLPVGKFKDL